MIKEVNRNGWLWLLNYSATENLKEIQAEQKKTNSEVGKYLFFSDEKKLLIDLAKNILEKYDLFNAKVPSYDTPIQSENGGFGGGWAARGPPGGPRGVENWDRFPQNRLSGSLPAGWWHPSEVPNWQLFSLIPRRCKVIEGVGGQ